MDTETSDSAVIDVMLVESMRTSIRRSGGMGKPVTFHLKRTALADWLTLMDINELVRRDLKASIIWDFEKRRGRLSEPRMQERRDGEEIGDLDQADREG